jgi:hypothetical protein
LLLLLLVAANGVVLAGEQKRTPVRSLLEIRPAS